jgi:hypothetical protein
VKLPSKYKNLVDLILTSKGLNRHESLKASKRLGMKNLADKTVLWDEKSSRWNFSLRWKTLSAKLPSKYKNLVDLILTSKGLNRRKSSKASKRLGTKNLAGETSIKIQKSCRFDPYQ